MMAMAVVGLMYYREEGVTPSVRPNADCRRRYWYYTQMQRARRGLPPRLPAGLLAARHAPNPPGAPSPRASPPAAACGLTTSCLRLLALLPGGQVTTTFISFSSPS